ncbi:MAG: Smr/MutS family protein [Myxococcota bacterium]
MSPGDGDGDDFADLFGGGTRRIDPGPKRVEPRTRPPVRTRPASGQAGPRFRWPDPDEPGCAAAEGVNDRQLLALRRGEPEPEERIDLHGARAETAGSLLARRIDQARGRGLRCVLVIHGRGKHSPLGEAVLKDGLPGWLTKGPTGHAVLAFAPAPDRLGGAGATVVLLRS